MVDASCLKIFNKTTTCSFKLPSQKSHNRRILFMLYYTLLEYAIQCQVYFGWCVTPFINNDVLPPVVLESNTNY